MSEQPAEATGTGNQDGAAPAVEVQVDPALIGRETRGLEPDVVQLVPELEGHDTFSARQVE